MISDITYLRIEHYSGHPEVTKAAELLLNEVEEKQTRLNRRDKWLRDSKKLVASLWIREDDMFRFGTKKDNFAGKNRKQVWMTANTLKLFKAMESLGWVTKVISAVAPVYAKGAGGLAAVYCRQLTFKQLLTALTEQDIELDPEAPLVTVTVDGNYVEPSAEFIEHERYKRTIDILEQHFKLLSVSSIKDMHSKALKDDVIRYRRRFSDRMGIGGRFYSPFCNWTKKERLSITFNSEPAVSLDFSQLHPTLLLLYTEGQGTETNLFSTDDVYHMPDYPDLPRAAHKKFINTILNAASKDAAAKSISSATTYWDIIEDRPVFKTYAGKEKRIGPSVWPDKPLADAHKYIEAFIFRHPNFEPVVYEGAWGALQFTDSNIIENVMLMANAKEVPVLPVHDELVAPKSKCDLIKRFMEDSFHISTGNRFNSHRPLITINRNP